MTGESRGALLFWGSIYVAIEPGASREATTDNRFLEVVVRPGPSSLWEASELPLLESEILQAVPKIVWTRSVCFLYES
jgi:hypothetical protein